MTTENEKTNLPATTNDADIAALAGAARNLITDETALKFIKGKWKTYADKEHPEVVGATESFVVDMLSYANGWVKWENKRPSKYIFRPVDGWIMPMRAKLPDNDKRTWPREARVLCREAEDAKAKTVAAVVTLARTDRAIAATEDQWDRTLFGLNTPAKEKTP